MGNRQALAFYYKIVVEQYIQIQSPRAPVNAAHSILLMFYSLQRIEQIQWREVGAELRRGINKVWLLWANGRRLIAT
jgi:hypothetical protein